MISIAVDHSADEAGEPARRIFGTPVRIGRGVECQIRLDASNRAISRVHLEVIEEAGRVFVHNRGSNPGTTRLDGRIVAPDEKLPVPEDGMLAISVLGDLIRIGRAGPLEVEAVLPGGARLGREALEPGRAVVLRAASSPVFASVDPAAWTRDEQSGGEIALFLDEGQPALVVLIRPKSDAVAIDRGEVAAPTAYLRPLETVRFAGYGLRLLEKGQAVMECTKAECGCLNAAEVTTCRACGADLAPASASAST
jgi:hypothetical protein